MRRQPARWCGPAVRSLSWTETDGVTAVKMMGDFADLWERAAADGTPVRAIVGEDPVEFAETFAQAYTGAHWIDKERARLTKSIEEAERAEEAR